MQALLDDYAGALNHIHISAALVRLTKLVASRAGARAARAAAAALCALLPPWRGEMTLRTAGSIIWSLGALSAVAAPGPAADALDFSLKLLGRKLATEATPITLGNVANSLGTLHEQVRGSWVCEGREACAW